MTGRAVGVRRRWEEVPERVRGWVETELGSPVVGTEEQTGGMSPGCASRLRTADGATGFVKAVGPELNPDTPTLFRREIRALRLLGAHRLWARLRTAYDEPEGWVALLLEDVPGRRPRLDDDTEMQALLEAVDELGDVVGLRVPGPPALPGDVDLLSARTTVARWREAVAVAETVSPALVPAFVRDDVPGWLERCAALVDLTAEDRLVHWDVRDDNVIVRPDGAMVFVDWGAASRGPAWADPLLARLERVTDPWFDDSVLGSPTLAELGDEHITTFLVALGTFLAHRSETAVDVNLPTLGDFRRRESARFLAGAARRLGLVGR